MTSCYGSTISGSQQSFFTETATCIVERGKKSVGYRFVPECNHAQESHFLCVFPIFAIFTGPQFFETQKFSYHGNGM